MTNVYESHRYFRYAPNAYDDDEDEARVITRILDIIIRKDKTLVCAFEASDVVC